MMYLLYGLFFLMIMISLGLIAIPFVERKKFKDFFIFACIFILVAFSLYSLTGNKIALKQWLLEGKKHYQLLETFEKLGGIDGAIIRIQQKLNQDPQDVQGWVILGKLYLSKGDREKANASFKEALELLPESTDIRTLYETSR